MKPIIFRRKSKNLYISIPYNEFEENKIEKCIKSNIQDEFSTFIYHPVKFKDIY